MFFHRKELMYDVKVQGADPRFGEMLLEQFGGATGELSAALTYWTQSFHVEDPAIRDMLHDIALEEFSHLEMVGRMIEQHTEKSSARDAAYRSTLFAVRGVGPHLVDNPGNARVLVSHGTPYERGKRECASCTNCQRQMGMRRSKL